jgi:hypothetical protein
MAMSNWWDISGWFWTRAAEARSRGLSQTFPDQCASCVNASCVKLIFYPDVLRGRMRYNEDVYPLSLAGLVFELLRPGRRRPN